jgi:S1-C subfamily serine protease
MFRFLLRPWVRVLRAELLALLLFVAFALLAFAARAQPADAGAVPATEAAPDSAGAPHVADRGQALQRALDAVVGVETVAVEDAGSAATLGHERQGSGVVIGSDGLVLTIGYLILEADHVDLKLDDGRAVPARVVAYDLATGFGLLQALAPLALEPVPLGSAAALDGDAQLLVVSGGDEGAYSVARMVSRRPFSGYWEYHIDTAVFTAPARTDHSGAGLFNADGELLGIGSLLVGDALGTGEGTRGNMFVPVDLLKPILAELRKGVTSHDSRRAWIGVNCVVWEGAVRVLRVTGSGPAAVAGLQIGDEIVAIDGVTVHDLASFYHALWQRDVERDVQLEIRRAGAAQHVTVRSQDRLKTLRQPQGV